MMLRDEKGRFLKGNKPYMTGKKHKPESIIKMSESQNNFLKKHSKLFERLGSEKKEGTKKGGISKKSGRGTQE